MQTVGGIAKITAHRLVILKFKFTVVQTTPFFLQLSVGALFSIIIHDLLLLLLQVDMFTFYST